MRVPYRCCYVATPIRPGLWHGGFVQPPVPMPRQLNAPQPTGADALSGESEPAAWRFSAEPGPRLAGTDSPGWQLNVWTAANTAGSQFLLDHLQQRLTAQAGQLVKLTAGRSMPLQAQLQLRFGQADNHSQTR